MCSRAPQEPKAVMMSDGLIIQPPFNSLPELRGIDETRVQKARSVMHQLAHIPLRLPDVRVGNNFLIRTNYGEGQLVKIYVKLGEIASFIVLSYKLHS